MANGIQITVVGNLTADPELKYNDGGNGMLTFSIAAERSYRKDDEWVNEVSYPDVIAWRNLAEDSAAVLEKGMRVIVTGRFEQRFWEDKDSGQKRSKWQLVADEIAVSTKVIESLQRKRKQDGADTTRPAAKPTRPAAKPTRPAARSSYDTAGDDGW